jgi:hypothetical protein
LAQAREWAPERDGSLGIGAGVAWLLCGLRPLTCASKARAWDRPMAFSVLVWCGDRAEDGLLLAQTFRLGYNCQNRKKSRPHEPD